VIGIAAIFLVAILIAIVLFVKTKKIKSTIRYRTYDSEELIIEDVKLTEGEKKLFYFMDRMWAVMVGKNAIISKEIKDSHEMLIKRMNETIEILKKYDGLLEGLWEDQQSILKALSEPKEATLKLNEDGYNKLKEILINNNEPILKALSEPHQALINSINGSFGSLHKKINSLMTTKKK
jgi:hypothetical protein